MSKEKFYKVGFILLLLINIGVVSFIFFSKPPHPKQERLKDKVTAILNFNKQQIKHYEVLIQNHQAKIRKEESELISLKRNLYTSIENEKISETYLDSIATRVKAIERIHTQHFLDIKQLCNKNQIQNFKKLTDAFSKYFDKPKMKIKKHDK